MSDVKVTRRQFLGMAGGLTAAAALAGGISAASASASGQAGDVSRTTGRELKSIPTTCQLCQARCGLLAFLRHGRLVTLEGNPEHPNSKGRVCAKGQAAVNLVYNPDRLLYPMKRAGARGDGTYERISWGEALDEIASKLKALRAGGHPDQFIFQGGAMASPRFVSRFLDAFGTTSAFFFSQPSSDTNRRLALLSTWGSEDGIGDVARSKFILNFGSNPYEAHWYHVPLIQRLIEARTDNSARLVTFD
ncbi:MAG TPA: molybdopterin-dependent oxidoreductase, partial [Dehalococcoidia bacterium]|nr:molybdopterin-dependent oxidoreductase [Dehalococcoidia bacterium]